MQEDPNTPNPNPSEPNTVPPEHEPEPHMVRELPPEFRPSIDMRESDQPAWTGWDVWLIVLVTVAAMFITSLVGFGLALHLKNFRGVSITDLARDPRLVIPVQSAAYLIVFGCMLWVVGRHRSRSFWRAVHWNFPLANWFVPFLGGIVLALTIQFASALLPIPKQLPIEKFFKNASSAYLMAVFGITLAPLMEELFFRGFLYPVFARRIGVTSGIVVTAILFALIHQSQLGYAWAPLLLLFIVGLVLTGVRAYTGSVGRSFLIHVGYNTTLFSLLWLQTDRFHNLQKAAAAIFTLKL